jgi:hypothetical protein
MVMIRAYFLLHGGNKVVLMPKPSPPAWPRSLRAKWMAQVVVIAAHSGGGEYLYLSSSAAVQKKVARCYTRLLVSFAHMPLGVLTGPCVGEQGKLEMDTFDEELHAALTSLATRIDRSVRGPSVPG